MKQYSNALINGGDAFNFHAIKPPNLLAQNAATSRSQATHLTYMCGGPFIVRTGKQSSTRPLNSLQMNSNHLWDSETQLRSEMLARKDAPTSDQDTSNKSGSKMWASVNWCYSSL